MQNKKNCYKKFDESITGKKADSVEATEHEEKDKDKDKSKKKGWFNK